MDFQEVIRTRRSVRSYSSRDIPKDALDRILDAARIAPSGNNRQPWSFVAVRDASARRQIAAHCYEQDFVGDAPVVVVCCGKKYPNSYAPHGDDCYLIDAIIAVDHMVLAARSEGIGSCWVGAFHPDPIAKLLRLPPGVEPLMVVPLGYPASPGAFRDASGRRPLADIVRYERFEDR